MKIAEVLLLINQKEEEVSLWNQRRHNSRLRSFKKVNGARTEDVMIAEYNVDECTGTITKLNADIRTLRQAVTGKNATCTVEWEVNGRKVTLTEAILLIKQMRREQAEYAKLGEVKGYSRVNDMGGSKRGGLFSSTGEDKFCFEEVFEVTYNTSEYREEAEKLTRQITKLEGAIQQANWNIEIPWEE